MADIISLKSIFGARAGYTLAMAIVLIVAPLLTFSESTIKNIIDRWLSQCIIIYDKKNDESGAILIQLYAYGSMPSSLPITMVTKSGGTINRISFVNQVEQATAPDDNNLLVHPLAGQRCPGELCPEVSATSKSERLTMRIHPVTSNYLYQLRVVTAKAVTPQEINVYSRPLQGEGFVCRVESASLANYFSRQSPGYQIFLLTCLFVVVSFLLGVIKDRFKGEEP